MSESEDGAGKTPLPPAKKRSRRNKHLALLLVYFSLPCIKLLRD